ncbi:hypothetical protein ACWIUD_08480 [Helicobacter sp. 23-1044]
MKFALKVALSIIVIALWQVISGDLMMACILGAFVFAILCISPKRDSALEESEAFKEMVREKNEQKLSLEEKRILEKKEQNQK